MSISRQSLLLLTVESVAIFLSVLLAFFVEEWRDDRREIRQMQEALAVISHELQSNAAEIEQTLPFHRESLPIVVEQVEALANGGDFPGPGEIRFANAPVLSTAAYSMAVNTGALERAPTDALIAISLAYQRIGQVDRVSISLAERNAQVRYNDGVRYLSGFVYFYGSIISTEEAALSTIAQARAAIEQAQ
ncbi:hypothetical protein [Hyphobacterium sp.]|uniref:hypothetical protein n=1 Tax=Hyphobacterium sp. TaxID=2004662 RepID=UPI003BAC23E6